MYNLHFTSLKMKQWPSFNYAYGDNILGNRKNQWISQGFHETEVPYQLKKALVLHE